MLIFLQIYFWKTFANIIHPYQIKKKTALKVMKLSKNDFVWSDYISEMIVIHTFQLVPFSLLHVLFVEPSNFNENLNHTLYSIPGVDWIKCLVRPVSCVNDFVSILCGSYLLPEILITSLFCSILISVHNKNSYFHLFNFQYILLSSGMGQSVILSIFKNSLLNFWKSNVFQWPPVLALSCAMSRSKV